MEEKLNLEEEILKLANKAKESGNMAEAIVLITLATCMKVDCTNVLADVSMVISDTIIEFMDKDSYDAAKAGIAELKNKMLIN